MSQQKTSLSQLLELNLALLLISTSGVLGRYIEMFPPVTIWWRCFLAAIFLFLFCWHQRVKLSIHSKQDVLPIIIAGVLLGAHWVTYFFSLQYSSVAVGMLSLFTFPVMTAFLEPLLLKTKFKPSHILLAIMVVIGIYLLAPEFDIENNYTLGILYGLVSALCYALRNILLKKKTQTYSGSALMLYQLVIITFLLWPTLFMDVQNNFLAQWPATLSLALFTTAMGHTLFVMSLKHFSVSSVSIISSLQPIYGIILGIIFLNEIPGWNTVLGGTLILATVVIESVRSFKNQTS